MSWTNRDEVVLFFVPGVSSLGKFGIFQKNSTLKISQNNDQND